MESEYTRGISVVSTNIPKTRLRVTLPDVLSASGFPIQTCETHSAALCPTQWCQIYFVYCVLEYAKIFGVLITEERASRKAQIPERPAKRPDRLPP